ncbi:MAG: DUF2760 domain-containing protein [Polyangiaceae bacterium]
MSDQDPNESPLGFFTRFWLAYIVFFKILFDGSYAKRINNLHPPKALPDAVVEADTQAELENKLGKDERRIHELEAELKALKSEASAAGDARADGALWLLGLLQKEGRFVDFLQQDITSFDDAEVGGAARVIHDGCKQSLEKHLDVKAIRTEEEGAKITLEEGYDAKAVKLTGNVSGKAPYSGTLRHKGWKATRAELPALLPEHDPKVLAQAEVEL